MPALTQNLALARDLLAMAREVLTASQIHGIEEDIKAGEPLLAVEFVSEFLSENELPISRALFEKTKEALLAMGSSRTKLDYLESLVR